MVRGCVHYLKASVIIKPRNKAVVYIGARSTGSALEINACAGKRWGGIISRSQNRSPTSQRDMLNVNEEITGE